MIPWIVAGKKYEDERSITRLRLLPRPRPRQRPFRPVHVTSFRPVEQHRVKPLEIERKHEYVNAGPPPPIRNITQAVPVSRLSRSADRLPFKPADSNQAAMTLFETATAMRV